VRRCRMRGANQGRRRRGDDPNDRLRREGLGEVRGVRQAGQISGRAGKSLLARIPHVWIKTRLKPRWVPHVLRKTCAKRDALARRVLEGADRRRVAIEGLLL